MSRDFIGSKIAIITKSQCRYVGTIIGIDAQTSSIILGNCKCLGTENRSGHLANGHTVGTILPIMQFANSDIEDLKIVDDEQTLEIPQQQQQQSYTMPVLSSPSQPTSIHDDPAIVSAVVSSSNKDKTSNSLTSSQLIHSLQHMTLSDEQSKTLPKNTESRIRSNSSELGPSWSLLSPSTWGNNNNNNNPKPISQQESANKSKFFDDFILDNNNNNTNQSQLNRSHQRSSNTHSTQTIRENDDYFNEKYDKNGLPKRQPFFSNDRSYPQRQQQQQQQQQQYRYQNGNTQYQKRYFYNNHRTQMPNQQRRTDNGGNRETFQDNPNDYDNDFDFETNNLKFNKLTNDDEYNHETDFIINNRPIQPQINNDSLIDHQFSYDKKKSFFDNLAGTKQLDVPTSYNRSKNQDTFGNDNYQRYKNQLNGNNYRRPNNNYRQQHGNEDSYYRQHNNNYNGYHYRY